MERYEIFQKHFKRAYKCGGCGWDFETFYSLISPPHLDKERKYVEDGMCAHCFCEWLVEEKRGVV